MHIKDITRLLGDVITSTMLALALVRQRLQQTTVDLGPEMVSEVILAIKELDGMSSTREDYALCLMANSFNSLSEKREVRSL